MAGMTNEEPVPPSGVGRDGWMFISFGVAVVALLVAIVAVGFGSRAISEAKDVGTVSAGAAPAGGVAATIMLSEFKLDPSTVTIQQGQQLAAMNMGSVEHNLAVDGQSIETPMIKVGDTATLDTSGLKPGKYTIICQVPGHKGAGMTGTLTVEASSSGGSGSAAAAPATTPTSMSADDMDALMAKNTKAFLAGVKTEGKGAQLLAPTVLPDGTKQFELTAKIVKWEVAPGKLVDAWTYNGTVPGPTIKVNDGDKVRVILHNQLPESTSIHFHGIHTPNDMDGVPDITQEPVKPGADFTYEFVAKGPAVGMYHSHQDAVKQVPNGLAGAFLIGEEPVPAGVTVSQEKIMMLNDAGTVGLTLNGKSFPATEPIVANLGEWVELHYMNEGQMIHPMHLHGLDQIVIAKDGFPLANPETEDTVLVGPGERYTVLIHADAPGAWAFHCHILSHAESDQGMFGMVTAMVVKG
jgi:FtsP/CotA-like multicopper oxidase with cupredoxin domain